MKRNWLLAVHSITTCMQFNIYNFSHVIEKIFSKPRLDDFSRCYTKSFMNLKVFQDLAPRKQHVDMTETVQTLPKGWIEIRCRNKTQY